jgi:hypothetical protein
MVPPGGTQELLRNRGVRMQKQVNLVQITSEAPASKVASEDESIFP